MPLGGIYTLADIRINIQLSAFSCQLKKPYSKLMAKKPWETLENNRFGRSRIVLLLKVYKITATFPREELYGLTSQMRRACASIPTNIAEGCGRETDLDFARFLQIAMGSATEIEYLFMLSNSLVFIENNQYNELNDEIIEIKKMLTCFIKTLRSGS